MRSCIPPNVRSRRMLHGQRRYTANDLSKALVSKSLGRTAMAEETARQMALDCREKSPDWPDRFSASLWNQ